MRIAILKPSPSSPSRLAAGMRQSLKKTSPVVEPLIPIFGSIRPTSKPGVSASTTNAEMPEWPRVGIGLREHGVDVRDARVRDEALAAVEDVLAAVAARGRAHRRGVGARARLGQRVRGEPFARREPRQEALLLLVGPRELEPERPELLHGDDQAARRADLRDLLDRDERHQRRRADAAVLLVEEDPEDLVARGRARRRPTGTRRSCRSPPRAARCARARGRERGRGSRAARRSAGRQTPRQVYAGNYGRRLSAAPDPRGCRGQQSPTKRKEHR